MGEDSFVVKDGNPYQAQGKAQGQPADNPPADNVAASTAAADPDPEPEQESTAPVREEMCFNHPWRPAYARCVYCKRPFCFADLIQNKDVFYCLEDAYRENAITSAKTTGPNRFTYVSSVLFLCSAALVLYFIVPQITPIFRLAYGQITANTGILSTIVDIASTMFGYPLIIISFVLCLLGFLCSYLVISNKNKKVFFSGVILAFYIIFFSYELLTTVSTGLNNGYLLYIMLLSIMNLCILVISRADYAGLTSERKFYEQGEWPKPGTYH